MGKHCGFYGVRRGRVRGVFSSWEACNASVGGHPGCEFKKFKTRSEAEEYVEGGGAGGTRTSVAGRIRLLSDTAAFDHSEKQRIGSISSVSGDTWVPIPVEDTRQKMPFEEWDWRADFVPFAPGHVRRRRKQLSLSTPAELRVWVAIDSNAEVRDMARLEDVFDSEYDGCVVEDRARLFDSERVDGVRSGVAIQGVEMVRVRDRLVLVGGEESALARLPDLRAILVERRRIRLSRHQAYPRGQ